MASGEAPQTSIAGLLPASPSSSQAPSDLLSETNPPMKNAWSEVVRGGSHAARSKAVSRPNDSQPAQVLETRHHSSGPHVGGMTHPVLPAIATTAISAFVPAKFQALFAESTENPSSGSLDSVDGFVDAPPILSHDDIGSPKSEERQVVCDTFSETHTASPDRSAKHAQQSPAKSPKPAWGKPSTKTGERLEPEPVMGAIAWPALSEARNIKSLEPSKSGTQRSSLKQPSLSSGHEHNVEEPNSLKEELGTRQGVHSSHKSFNLHQIAGNGNILRESTSSNTVFPVKVMHTDDFGQSKQSGGRESKVGAIVDSTAPNRRNVASPSSSNNIPRDHGRGNQGWLSHGRAYANSTHVYANSRENTISPQHQWATHKSLRQRFVPFFNPNPGFAHAAGFPNMPGGMYYIPTPAPEPLLGATYFVPPVSGVFQGVMTPALDPMILKQMLLNQIEYYFSVGNLCRDIYLRSNMDEQGFVPISLIGNFNRVQKITQNHLFIVEALQASSLLEVQGDKVRKRGDWATWLLPSSQRRSAVRDFSMDMLSESLRRTEIDQPQSGKVENQSNGVRYSRSSQIEEKLESHHGSRPLVDSLIGGLTNVSGEDGKSVDGGEDDLVELKDSSQYSGLESHQNIK